MSRIISASIDLAKIDRSKITKGKNGQKYYSISISVNDEADKFGNDVAITTGQSKEEREAKAAKVYLGNGKTVWASETPGAKPASAPAKAAAAPAAAQSLDDDLPF
jgi:hypothetical protein